MDIVDWVICNLLSELKTTITHEYNW